MTNFNIALFGAGKIGETITALLTGSGRYTVKVCDKDVARAKEISALFKNSEAHALDLDSSSSTLNILKGADAVISALPYFLNTRVAEYAKDAGIHYLDLTEDVQTTKAVALISAKSKSAFIPQCGLAPGFISTVAAHMMRKFQELESVKLRVGALPIFPSNKLKYNLTWSTDGLINEYGNLCEAIENSEHIKVLPLEGYERFSLDGAEYEAFNTSGGLGSLATSFAGKVKSLNYKSIRYPGHKDLIQFLMNDLKFNEDRDTLRSVFERSLPTTLQDKCIIFVEVRGIRNKKFEQLTYASTIYNQIINGRHFGAIQITTASGICGVLDLLLTKNLSKSSGIINAEDVDLSKFLDNEFGKYYKDSNTFSVL